MENLRKRMLVVYRLTDAQIIKGTFGEHTGFIDDSFYEIKNALQQPRAQEYVYHVLPAQY